MNLKQLKPITSLTLNLYYSNLEEKNLRYVLIFILKRKHKNLIVQLYKIIRRKGKNWRDSKNYNMMLINISSIKQSLLLQSSLILDSKENGRQLHGPPGHNSEYTWPLEVENRYTAHLHPLMNVSFRKI